MIATLVWTHSECEVCLSGSSLLKRNLFKGLLIDIAPDFPLVTNIPLPKQLLMCGVSGKHTP